MVRQQRTVGAVVKVPLEDGWHSYAQVLGEADFAFFDARTRDELSPEEVVSRPVLFRVAVSNHAVTRGRWLKVGKAPVAPELSKPVKKFMQDLLDPRSYSLYLGGEIRPATRAECEGLERTAVWEPEHVESRLRDHYAGVPNVWVEQLRLKPEP